MSLVAGIDLGARRTKVVLLDQGRPHAFGEAPTGHDFDAAARAALAALGTRLEDLSYVLATGIGRVCLPWRSAQASALPCLARALGLLAPAPAVRRLLDVGAQQACAVRVDARGQVAAFRHNDRCAAGGGRFLERAALLLEVPPSRAAAVAAAAPAALPLRAVCAVLGESEIVSKVSQGAAAGDILAGVCLTLGGRAADLALACGGDGPLLLVGGPAENAAFARAVAARLTTPVVVPDRPAFATALGAASLGWYRWREDVRARSAVPAPAPLRPYLA